MRRRIRSAGPAVLLALALGGASPCSFAVFHHAHKKSETAQVVVDSGKAECSVDIDGTPAGKTGATGKLTLSGVPASDHYIHVDCPGQPEATYFISPAPGSSTSIQPKPALSSSEASAASSLGAAENNMELRRLLASAVDARSDGQFPEAIQTLRQAIQLDPGNPGLHHELGMTFLMIRDWDDAGVELREAIRHNPSSADAHSGLGYALEKLGDLQSALKEFRIATHLDPNDQSYEDHYVEVLGMMASEQGEKKKKSR
ncbi:MAG: tetratricopeptide repeat protein [Terriglobia bacterium]